MGNVKKVTKKVLRRVLLDSVLWGMLGAFVGLVWGLVSGPILTAVGAASLIGAAGGVIIGAVCSVLPNKGDTIVPVFVATGATIVLAPVHSWQFWVSIGLGSAILFVLAIRNDRRVAQQKRDRPATPPAGFRENFRRARRGE